MQKTIFNKVARVEAGASHSIPFVGQGLTFCKMAIETHGGTIRVKSVAGEGTTFRIDIPKESAEQDVNMALNLVEEKAPTSSAVEPPSMSDWGGGCEGPFFDVFWMNSVLDFVLYSECRFLSRIGMCSGRGLSPGNNPETEPVCMD